MKHKRNPGRGLSQLLIVAMLASYAPSADAIAKIPTPRPRPVEAPKKPAKPADTAIPEACPTDADRKDVGLCEQAVPEKCAGEFSKARKDGGIGKAIRHWPDASKQEEYAKAFTAFVDKKQDEYLNQLSSSHKALDGKPVSLKNSINARAIFFQAEFSRDILKNGTHLDVPVGVIPTCEGVRRMAKHLSAYFTAKSKLNTADSGTTADACSGSFHQMYENYKEAQKTYEHIRKFLDSEIEAKPPAEFLSADKKTKKIFIGFQKMFDDQSKVNEKNLEEAKAKLSPELYQKLKDEYEHLWVYNKDANKSRHMNGVYAQFLAQLKTERELVKAKAEVFKKNAEEFESLKKRCEGGGAVTPAVSNKPGKGSDVTEKPADSTTNPPTTKGDGNDGVREPPHREPVDDNKDTKDNTKDNTKNTSTTTDTTPPPPPPAKPNAGGEFLKNNWMWLAGGGVLAVGGYFAYKYYKKKKDERDYWANPANYNVTSGSVSASTSTVINIAAGGQVPAGTKIILTNAPSAPTAGATMAQIDVALVNASGVVQAIDGLAIEASCLTPNPCSLSGGKSVTTVGGKASFTGLVFNQPDKGVTLQFSGPGLQSVSSPGTFDVGGNASRQ